MLPGLIMILIGTGCLVVGAILFAFKECILKYMYPGNMRKRFVNLVRLK